MFPQRKQIAIALVVSMLYLVSIMAPSVTAQDAGPFPGLPDLDANTRVYDETGTSLSPEQVAQLEGQIADLEAVGADTIVYVRDVDASPEETLDQVEALQQAWVAETGADQNTAVAILINRNPDDPNDARAGIFVGSAFDDGNVPRDEQEAIVSEELIPPLRDGDVAGSLLAGLDRLESSIVNGPPQGAFEGWASRAADSWLPWASLGAAVAGLGAAWAMFRGRQTITAPEQAPTTTRPGDLSPAVAGALAAGSAQASAVPASLLDLAARDALDIEQESDGGRFGKPTVQVRLLDRGLVRDDIEAALWNELDQRAEQGMISGKNLAKSATDSTAVRAAVTDRLRNEAWLDERAGGRKAGVMTIALVAFVLATFSVVVAAVGENWLPAPGIIALAILAVAAVVMFDRYSRLSRTGQEAAIPWRAYREGLKEAATDDTVDLNLDAVLADAVAMNLGTALDSRLKAANESGQALRAFTSATGLQQDVAWSASFPWWIAFSTVTSPSGSAASGSTVSSGGAGGGGGAAGST